MSGVTDGISVSLFPCVSTVIEDSFILLHSDVSVVIEYIPVLLFIYCVFTIIGGIFVPLYTYVSGVMDGISASLFPCVSTIVEDNFVSLYSFVSVVIEDIPVLLLIYCVFVIIGDILVLLYRYESDATAGKVMLLSTCISDLIDTSGFLWHCRSRAP